MEWVPGPHLSETQADLMLYHYQSGLTTTNPGSPPPIRTSSITRSSLLQTSIRTRELAASVGESIVNKLAGEGRCPSDFDSASAIFPTLESNAE
ncbi:Hypothetical protein NTJ_10352 [Nesidiocoris tenuis]|nr:Hypothetical protein NTJ_10352 [Nesidiocoris tenuis]